MAYRHYQTTGFVIGHLARGEANRLYQVLTPDFGLIFVLAQGVRLEKSKLRYNLQNYCLANFDLVRGKEFWRLTGAEKVSLTNSAQTVFLGKIGVILLRLIHGELASEIIFSDLKQVWELLANREEKFTPSQLENLEIFFLIRLLANLGYLAPSPATVPILALTNFTPADLSQISSHRVALIKIINTSFVASGL